MLFIDDCPNRGDVNEDALSLLLPTPPDMGLSRAVRRRQPLDALLHPAQPLLGQPVQHLRPLVEVGGRLDADVARRHLLGEPFELLHQLLEGEVREGIVAGVGHDRSSTRAASRPAATSMSTRSPVVTSAGSRTTRPSVSRTTA